MPVLPDPSTPVLDTFDGNLHRWDANMLYNFATMTIASSQLKPTANFQSNTWMGFQSSDHEAWATIGALPAGSGRISIGVRSVNAPNNVGLSSNTLYQLQIYASGAAFLIRTLNDSDLTIGDYGAAGTFAVGERACLRVQGTLLSVWRYRAGAWALLDSANPPTPNIWNTEISGPGRCGLLADSDATFAARFNDFGGGNLSSGSVGSYRTDKTRSRRTSW